MQHQFLRIAFEVGLALILMALSSQVSVSLPGLALPLTFQSMCAIMLPLVIARRNAAGGIVLFLILALFGLPILAGGASGAQHFTGLSGGFLMGLYIVAQGAGILKKLIRHPRLISNLFIFLSMHVLLLSCGLLWIFIQDLGVITWADYVSPFLPGIVVKSFIGTIVVSAVGWIKKRRVKLVN